MDFILFGFVKMRTWSNPDYNSNFQIFIHLNVIPIAQIPPNFYSQGLALFLILNLFL